MQQTCAKGVKDKARLGGKGDLLGIVQEIETWPYYQMGCAQTRIILENSSHKILWDFKIQMAHLMSARSPDLRVN